MSKKVSNTIESDVIFAVIMEYDFTGIRASKKYLVNTYTQESEAEEAAEKLDFEVEQANKAVIYYVDKYVLSRD